ncbi:hypothetical protein MMC34_005179 [Xylographa carneopallida]|nr:hypothetical protein [Xylographa carneopallida]
MASSEIGGMPRILWQHSDPESSQMWHFKQMIEKKRGVDLPTFHELYDYSVTRRIEFWQDCWEEFRVIHEGSYGKVVDSTARIDALPKWFSGVRLNFAENLLYTPSFYSKSTRSNHTKEDDKIAVVEVREGLSSYRPLTWAQLRARTSLFASALRAHGVKKGDRVAVVSSNSIDTLCVFLGTTSLGGLFSSSSTDMGVKGILDRLKQIKPRWVFIDDVAVYNGKTNELREKMQDIEAGMEGEKEFQGVVSMPRFQDKPRDVSQLRKVTLLEEFLSKDQEGELRFERVGFEEGFLIVYSSGTTGQPKCIVHSVGGVILGSMKEGRLHRDINEQSRMLQFTTTGWIMYLAAVQTLMFGATLIMYDGSPFLPRVDTFLRLIEQQKVTHFGISPRYLSTLQTASISPAKSYDLSSLKIVTSTGMVLPTSLYKYFYSENGFPKHAQLANISGGTDLAGAFADCVPILPIYETGGCQGRSLGVDVRVYDSTIEAQKEGERPIGREVPEGEPGELVAIKPFPNMPICFFGDAGNQKYQAAYFTHFDNVWTHGDFIQIEPKTKAIIFLGRADGVLNPSGIRFGSAEVYSIVDTHFGSVVEDSICVGQRRPGDEDESVILFLKMRPGKKFHFPLVKDIKEAIARGLSRRHVPKHVFETPEIPTTVNLKKVELPVKQIVSGQIVKPSGTLLNPGSLEYYYQFAKVEELVGGERSKL